MVRCSNCGWDNPEGLRSCEKCNAPLIFDVFISYSRKDYVDDAGNVFENNILSKIKDALKANEMSYWFDEEGIYSGDEFASVLTNAIRNSRVFLFISSVNSNQSKWTSNEISTALEFEKPIIPFRIDNSPYNDSVMMKIVSLDRIECNNKDIAITKLLRAIRHHLPNRMRHQQFSDINMGSLFEKSIDKLIEDRLSSKKTTPLTPQEYWDSINKEEYDQVMVFFLKVEAEEMSPELRKDAEKIFWDLTLKQESVKSLVKFKEMLPKSKFAGEASKIVADCMEWESVKKSNDIFSVKVFLGKHNRIITKKEITLLYNNLRSIEISEIKKDIKGFPAHRLGLLIKRRCISETDFTSEEWDMMKDVVIWESTDKKSIYSINEYLKDRPNSIFSAEAIDVLDELRKEELYKMKESPEMYSSEIIFKYLHSGLFHPKDLFEAGVATVGSLEMMNTENSWDLPHECSSDRYQTSDRCLEIYLFGLPYTGKTTIMSSLIGTSSNEYCLDMAGGNCMYSLWRSAEKSNFPIATSLGALPILCVNMLNNPQNKNSGYRKVKIIDMAGEDFCFKMVCDNSNANLERADLSISTFLTDNNSKVFFVIIDPTWISKPLINKSIMMDKFGDKYMVMKDKEFSQEYVLCNFFSKLRSPENRILMQKVKAVNIIVTKADKLGAIVEERLNAAQNMIRESCGRSYHILEECCMYYGLPTPRIIPFSIGKVYVGGVYEQETISVNLLIEAVRKHLKSCRIGLWDKLSSILNS